MASVTGYTAQRMKAIEDASFVSAAVVGDNLILTRYDTTTLNAGNVRGPQGIQGATGQVTTAQLNSASLAGEVKMWPFDGAIPAGHLELNGQTVNSASTLYPDLWARAPIGWKSGQSLILPDARGRFIVGLNTADTSFDTILETGGSKNAIVVSHTHGISAHTHALPDHNHAFPGHTHALPAHTHGIAVNMSVDGGHTHTFSGWSAAGTADLFNSFETVTRLASASNNGFATGSYMSTWNAINPPRLAGSGGFGESNATAGMAVGYVGAHYHSFSGTTGDSGSLHSHVTNPSVTSTSAATIADAGGPTITGGGSGTGQVITSQAGALATNAASPDGGNGTNANLPPYLTLRFIIRAY